MSAIDLHTHAFPDELAARAIAKLEEGCPWKAFGDGTVGGLLKSMDAADIDVSAVCPIATKPDQVKGIFQWCKKIRSDRIDPLPSAHPLTKKLGDWMEKFAQEGFVGIKLHPMYQDFVVDDALPEEIYRQAAKHGLFITMHCGQDIAWPPTDDRVTPARLRRVIEKFPDLKLVATHMGGWRMWDEAQKHLLGTPVYMETSFSLAELGKQRAVDFIGRHGVQRVCMGSDWPWDRQGAQVQAVKDLGLSAQDTQAILYANAAKLLGL